MGGGHDGPRVGVKINYPSKVRNLSLRTKTDKKNEVRKRGGDKNNL